MVKAMANTMARAAHFWSSSETGQIERGFPPTDLDEVCHAIVALHTWSRSCLLLEAVCTRVMLGTSLSTTRVIRHHSWIKLCIFLFYRGYLKGTDFCALAE